MRGHLENELFLLLSFLLALLRYIPSLGYASILVLSYKRQGLKDVRLIQCDHPEVAFAAEGYFAINCQKEKKVPDTSSPGYFD